MSTFKKSFFVEGGLLGEFDKQGCYEWIYRRSEIWEGDKCLIVIWFKLTKSSDGNFFILKREGSISRKT